MLSSLYNSALPIPTMEFCMQSLNPQRSMSDYEALKHFQTKTRELSKGLDDLELSTCTIGDQSKRIQNLQHLSDSFQCLAQDLQNLQVFSDQFQTSLINRPRTPPPEDNHIISSLKPPSEGSLQRSAMTNLLQDIYAPNMQLLHNRIHRLSFLFEKQNKSWKQYEEIKKLPSPRCHQESADLLQNSPLPMEKAHDILVNMHSSNREAIPPPQFYCPPNSIKPQEPPAPKPLRAQEPLEHLKYLDKIQPMHAPSDQMAPLTFGAQGLLSYLDQLEKSPQSSIDFSTLHIESPLKQHIMSTCQFTRPKTEGKHPLILIGSHAHSPAASNLQLLKGAVLKYLEAGKKNS